MSDEDDAQDQSYPQVAPHNAVLSTAVPLPPPTPLPPTRRPPSVSSALTGWLQGLMWVAVVVSASTGVLSLRARESVVQLRYTDSVIYYASWYDREAMLDERRGQLLIVEVALFVVLIVWTAKSHRATSGLFDGGRKWKLRWAITGWLVPFANLVIPKLVLNEIERLASAPRDGTNIASNWHQRPPMTIGRVFWACFVVSGASAALGVVMVDVSRTIDVIEFGYIAQAVGLFGRSVAWALGALYFRKLGRMLTLDALTRSSA
jgi:hypothetical protein